MGEIFTISLMYRDDYKYIYDSCLFIELALVGMKEALIKPFFLFVPRLLAPHAE